MRNLLIAAVGAVTLSALVACSETSTEPVSASSSWFSSSNITVTENPFADTWNPSLFGETAPGQTAANYCGFYSGLVGETWEVGVKWESDDGVGNLPTAGGFEFGLEDDTYLNWKKTGNNDMRMVLVKGGDEHNLYFYNGVFPGPGAGNAPDAEYAEGLHAPPVGQGNIPTVSHFAYCYIAGESLEGEGCTPGYWRNHMDRWVGYTTDQDYRTVFGLTDVGFDGTLGEAIVAIGGGDSALARAAVAALLSAAHPDVDYEHDANWVIELVQEAYDEEGRSVEEVKDLLDELNNRGCPLGGTRAQPNPPGRSR
jgi:hypothetical protein